MLYLVLKLIFGGQTRSYVWASTDRFVILI